MDNLSKEILGSWIQAIGTVIAAIGSTPSNVISSDLLYDLDIWGNVLQATGNALQADDQGKISPLVRIGNEVQSIGNVTVVAGLVIDFEQEPGQKLIITGNWLQALGALVLVGDELENETTADQSINIIGNLLQAIGNSLQALSGVYELEQVRNKYKDFKNLEKHINSESLKVSGSWIQAVGSVISLIGQIIVEEKKIN